MKKIEARNIHKSFQELNVLQGIDLDVEEGEAAELPVKWEWCFSSLTCFRI